MDAEYRQSQRFYSIGLSSSSSDTEGFTSLKIEGYLLLRKTAGPGLPMSLSSRKESAAVNAGPATSPATGMAPAPLVIRKRAVLPPGPSSSQDIRSRRLSNLLLISSSVSVSILRSQFRSSWHSGSLRSFKSLFASIVVP